MAFGTFYLGGFLRNHGSIREALRYYGGPGYGDVYVNAVSSHYNCVVKGDLSQCRADLLSEMNP